VTKLFRDLLIGVTAFFRDGDAFEALRRVAIPRLFEGRGADDAVRVWVPGCATGEEAYSIAMLLREHMDGLRAAPRVQVFATDIDEPALNVVRSGRYPAAMVDGTVPQDRLRRFFTADGESAVVGKDVRDLCIFSAHSVVRDPPFSRIDLVSCRNLLIYLDGEVQRRVIPVFHYALRPGGWLFLGPSESVGQYGELFASADKKHRIFRRRDHASAVRVPLWLHGPRSGHHHPDGAGERRPGERPAHPGPRLRSAVEARMLEDFAPAHVVVDREGDVVPTTPPAPASTWRPRRARRAARSSSSPARACGSSCAPCCARRWRRAARPVATTARSRWTDRSSRSRSLSSRSARATAATRCSSSCSQTRARRCRRGTPRGRGVA
jgi:two-component system CheB/CheR fusion protein